MRDQILPALSNPREDLVFLYSYISLVQRITRSLQFIIMMHTFLVIYLQPAIWIAFWNCLWIDKKMRLKGTFSLKL